MNAPDTVLELVERFDAHRDAYKSPEYNETQVRREFIDPFFEAMGWDVNNRRGYAEPYKDVVHEDAIRIGGVVKAPDYSFRLGGRRLFFLEAKKPAVNLREDPMPAYQLRRYAWTAKLPVSILSDFEEFIVYDTRVKPAQEDKASAARVLYIPYTDYADRWGEIASLFSPQAIQKGALDKYVVSASKKRGTAEVDDAFLAEIEEWRDLLARNIALRNHDVSPRDLNFAVQATIDRIVFLRICEDRAIEPYGQLKALLNGGDTYARLRVLYERADERYNSGLFHFHKERERCGLPDTLTPRLIIDDKVLKAIIKRLYYPESPYEFSVLPAEILGQVYERFLGSVIRLTTGGQAKVEQKPEVRKAGGVYYTPSYIVDYIVKHTVGKLLEGKTPQDVAGVTETWRPSKTGRPLAILDPACGSGSFLLGAYQYLLDWHLDYYAKESEKWSTGKNPRIYQDHHGVWRLVTAERKRILLANIYGVDIDPQAVEVTKLSLLLRVLEGENADTLQKQFSLFHERALPDLANNIKCGNSLIGPDFYQGRQLDAFDEEETYRVNAFDWNAEFPQIMQSGGFDAVIGNPPWGAALNKADLEYLRVRHERVVRRMVDTYIYFLDNALLLSRTEGVVGYVIPSTVLNQVDARKLRQVLLDRGLTSLVDLGQAVFGRGVLNTTTILVTRANSEAKTMALGSLRDVPPTERPAALQTISSILSDHWRKQVIEDPELTFFVSDLRGAALLTRLRANFSPLKSIMNGGIQRGVSPDTAKAHVLDAETVARERIEQDLLRPSISGGQIKRYGSWKVDRWILYTTRATNIASYPEARAWLEKYRSLNTCKEVIEGKHPFWALHRGRNEHIFKSPKLIGITTSKRIELILDQDQSLYVTDAMYVFSVQEKSCLLACMVLLQSKFFHFLYEAANQNESRVIPQVKASKLDNLPIPSLEHERPATAQLCALASRMLDLHKRLQAANTEHERGVLRRQVAATDDELDRLVYELYELTDEEIAVVEGAGAQSHE